MFGESNGIYVSNFVFELIFLVSEFRKCFGALDWCIALVASDQDQELSYSTLKRLYTFFCSKL